MTIDYSIYDLKRAFTIHEAAQAYAQTEHEPENQPTAYNAMYAELLREVKGNYLQHRITRDIRENWIKAQSPTTDYTDWSKAEIWRDDLYKWFEARGLKSKFLFKEMRVDSSMSRRKGRAPAIKPIVRESELHTLIENAYLVLILEYHRPPKGTEMLKELKARSKEFDPAEIIQEIKNRTIYWASSGGYEQKMTYKTLQNLLSGFNKNHEKHKVIKINPA